MICFRKIQAAPKRNADFLKISWFILSDIKTLSRDMGPNKLAESINLFLTSESCSGTIKEEKEPEEEEEEQHDDDMEL